MEVLAETLADAAIGFIVALPFIIFYHAVIIKKSGRSSFIPHIIAAYIFCYIISFIFTATEIPDVSSFSLTMLQISITPFIIENNEQLLLNILLFVPFGFFSPLLWKRFQNIFRAFFLGLFFSLFIEITQLFCHRVTDIDDLIMNTIGTIIGYLIFITARLIIPKLGNFFCNSSLNRKSEIYVYIATVFIASFFIKPLMPI
ncbi:MAG: VanZ family protein [Oscillospiraceae bacterium]|nr:VanZ family protein [Oscillospiraceae bacterium]